MKHCETFSDDPSMPSTSTSSDKDKGSSEQAAFKLLEKLLEFMKGLLKDMMRLLELTEGKSEAPAEIPVGEIDPAKIQQLVEMGFSQSDAVDALLVTSSVPEAAEHLVSMLERNPTGLAPVVAASAALAEELASDAIVEAALAPRAPQFGAPQLSGPKALDDTQKRESTLMERDTPLSALKPLNRDDLQERVEFICKDIVTHCLRLLNKNRSVVLGLAELITIFAEDHLARSYDFVGTVDKNATHAELVENVRQVCGLGWNHDAIIQLQTNVDTLMRREKEREQEKKKKKERSKTPSPNTSPGKAGQKVSPAKMSPKVSPAKK
uniref:UBA domain-containing protein n=1 Tax=Meloidogyne incognita TaxID=6306 RepID=A0A914KUE9_MELIC